MLEEYQGLINEISNTQQLLKNELKSALDENGENLFGTVDINRGQMLQVKGMNNTGANIYFPAILLSFQNLKLR